MYKSKLKVIIAITIVIAFYLLSFTFNDWLSLTMQRHQLIQLTSMLILGIITNIVIFQFSVKNVWIGISLFIFITASIIFWMLPLSIDFAVIYEWINRVMHLNIFIVGILISTLIRGDLNELKIYFLGMHTAMSFAIGIALRSFNILLCSSFDILQQQETGLYLIYISIALFVFTIIIFFRLGNKKEI